MADDNNPDVTSEEGGGTLTPNNGSPIDEAEPDGRKDMEETSDGDAGPNDVPKISDSVEDLKNQLGRLSDKIDSQFVREQKDIRQMQKRMTVSLSVVLSLTVLSILITVFSWFSQRGEQSVAEDLGERINSFTLMDSLIEDLQRDLNLAGVDSEDLSEQLVGFQNTLDIAIEQISLSVDEKIGAVNETIGGLEALVAGFDDTFDAFGDTNLAMSTEIRRVVQSNARLEEFEETLQALILLEKEKYYDLVTAQIEIQTEETGEEDENAGSMNVDDKGYIFFSQDQ
jgi:molecular chaperone GrpE (heat shock protein)